MSDCDFVVGDWVEKVVGDYDFEGEIVSKFVKRDGQSYRYVVENADRLLHIFSAKQLRKLPMRPSGLE